MPALTLALRKEYEDLFNNCKIRLGRINAVEKIINKIQGVKDRYQNVSNLSGVPWFFSSKTKSHSGRNNIGGRSSF